MAVAATGVAIAVAEGLRPVFAQVPTLPFTAAAVVVAWRASLGAALTTLALGAAAVWFLFLPPIYSWQIKSAVTLVQLAGFVGVGVLVAWAIDNQRAAQAAAEAALRERDRFLEAAAHELRTPVTALKGTAELLVRQQRRGRLDEERLGDGLRRMVEAGERLALLVDDLLDISRLRTGRLTLRQEPVDLTALTRGVTEAFGDGLDGSHRLEVTASEGPLVVRGDRVRLAQVLNHLLDNAAKFSPDGGTIRVDVAADGAGVWLTVRDEGIGLAPGSAEAIFAPGHRAGSRRGADMPGLGLGLGICRGIVERHGGRIVAESAGEGRGTTVRVWLPTGGPSG
ncbi:MAG: ATP-binding protein [Chloroflexota bacterium]|nr:ATP-binding protein [Chloroflexota bacterium]